MPSKRKFFPASVCLLVILLLGSLSFSSTMAASPRAVTSAQAESPYMAGELVVKFTPQAARLLRAREDRLTALQSLPNLDRLNRQYGVMEVAPVFDFAIEPSAEQRYGLSDIYFLRVPRSTDIWRMAADYRADPNVIYAEPNFIVQLLDSSPSPSSPSPTTSTALGVIPDDPFFGDQYALHNVGQQGGVPDADVNAPEAWSIQTGTPSVLIAVLDTGADYTHPDLAAKVRTDIDWDFADNDADAMDRAGHGTGVAGSAAAATNNAIGIAGMCWGCEILPIRVGDSPVHIGSVAVAQGIVYATGAGAQIISMSLGGQCSELWADAINYAYEQGVTLIAAAGTEVTFVVYPALFRRVIAVSATDRYDRFASFSAHGPAVDVAAPGAGRLVLRPGGYGYGDGTSYATPLVAGLAGLLLSENPALTNLQIRQILRDTAKDLGAPGFDPYFGYGRVDAFAALTAAASPPAGTYNPGTANCGCLLEQILQAKPQRTRLLPDLYRLRDDILAPTPLGRQITDLYYRHSAQVAMLMLRDGDLRAEILDLLAAGQPYLDSLLNGDGQRRLDGQLIARAEKLIQTLADKASPELRADLLRTWEALDLRSYAGRPVRDVVDQLNGRSPRRTYLPIIYR